MQGLDLAELSAVPAFLVHAPALALDATRLPTVEAEVAAKPLRHRVMTFAYVGTTIHSSAERHLAGCCMSGVRARAGRGVRPWVEAPGGRRSAKSGRRIDPMSNLY